MINRRWKTTNHANTRDYNKYSTCTTLSERLAKPLRQPQTAIVCRRQLLLQVNDNRIQNDKFPQDIWVRSKLTVVQMVPTQTSSICLLLTIVDSHLHSSANNVWWRCGAVVQRLVWRPIRLYSVAVSAQEDAYQPAQSTKRANFHRLAFIMENEAHRCRPHTHKTNSMDRLESVHTANVLPLSV